LLAAACAVWLALRLIYNGLRELVPDEAYYWVWSRHLASGYLDHPPMVAWVIRAGTAVFGTSEFSVRFGAAVLMMGTILIVIGLTRKIGSDWRAARLAGWILILSPFTAVMGTIIAPDTPACFFGIGALAAAVVASGERGRKIWWLVFGVCTGLAMDSKYTAVVAAGSVGIAVLCTRRGRRELRSPWLWLGLLASVAIFMPVVLWNQRHDWASFKFQWHHGSATASDAGTDTSADAIARLAPLTNLSIYIAGQAALYTPVLFVLGIMAIVSQWRKWSRLELPAQMVLISATLPLVFFGVFSLRHRPEVNWPVFAYLPMTVVLARWIVEEARAQLWRWVGIGVGVAGAAMVIGQVPEIVRLVPVRMLASIPSRWEDMFGWEDYGRALGDRADGATVYCTSYENAAEAAFYMPGRPEVWTISTDRPTAYDFFDGRPDLASLARVLCVTRAGASDDVPKELRGFANISRESWQTTALDRVVRRRRFIIAQR
jgi:4-amino-4-deoxy-L-arabinose transferase-like glycosyltransferase